MAVHVSKRVLNQVLKHLLYFNGSFRNSNIPYVDLPDVQNSDMRNTWNIQFA